MNVQKFNETASIKIMNEIPKNLVPLFLEAKQAYINGEWSDSLIDTINKHRIDIRKVTDLSTEQSGILVEMGELNCVYPYHHTEACAIRLNHIVSVARILYSD